MKSQLVELDNKEALGINGGGWLYDLYRIILEEKDDFVEGVKEGLNNSPF